MALPVIFPHGAVSSICGAGRLTDFASFVASFSVHLGTSILAFGRREADGYFLFKSVSLPKWILKRIVRTGQASKTGSSGRKSRIG